MTEIRIDAEYPLPWRWNEEWTGTSIQAANNKRVVLITKGRAGSRIDEERALAEWIIRCVNVHGAAEIDIWLAEPGEPA